MKQTKHFVSNIDGSMGIPACKCFGRSVISKNYLPALPEEIAKTIKQVTCKNCWKTRVFRKLK